MRPSRTAPALAVLLALVFLLGGVAMAAPAEATEAGGLRNSLELIECPCYDLEVTDLRIGDFIDCLPNISFLTEGASLEGIQIPYPIDCYPVDPCFQPEEGPIAQVEAALLVERQELPSSSVPCPGPGRIIVDKVTDPAGSSQAFAFETSWGSFHLSDGSDPQVSPPLLAGVYSVAEVNLPAGWSLDGATCDDGSDPSAIVLHPDTTVTCTFYNSEVRVLGPNASLTIVKMTNSAGGEGFGFTTSENLSGPFTLDDGGSMLFGELEPGAYTVTEDGLGGDWAFQNVACDALDWSANGQSVTVNLAEGEAALCTFYNIAELPFTGGSSLLMPLLIVGLGAVALGTGMVLVPAIRRRGGE